MTPRPSPRRDPSRSPSGPPRPDLVRPTGADHQPEYAPAADAEGVFSSPKGDPVDPALALRGFVLGFTIAAAVGPISLLVIRRTLAQGQLLRPGLRPGRRHGRRHVRGDRRVRPERDHGRPGQRPAGPRPGRRRLPAVAGLADHPLRPDRGRDRHDRAPRLRRRVPLDPRPDPGQPDDDPVVRGVVRGPRRDQRGDRRCGARRPRRPPRLDDLVDRPDDGRRRRCGPASRRPGSTGSTSSPA